LKCYLTFARTIAIPIGNSILLNELRKYIPKYSHDIEVQAVVRAGPLAIDKLSSSLDTANGVRVAYSKAIQHILVFALTVVCVSIPAASGMKWLNIKKVSRARVTNDVSDYKKENNNGIIEET